MLRILITGTQNNCGNMNLFQIHFDEDENFTHDSYSGINLYYVAVHEFGHVLGVKHSGVRRTIMYPSYPGYLPVPRLPKLPWLH